jgi:hypothetical protein
MLIVALVLAVVGLAALVTAVVTSNELVAWVCIAASVLGVILLIIDAIRERQHSDDNVADGETVAGAGDSIDDTYQNFDTEYDYPEESPSSAFTDTTTEDAEPAHQPESAHEPKSAETEAPAEPGEPVAEPADESGTKPASG